MFIDTKELDDLFHNGFDSKMAEIEAMGFEAARDKFNLDVPSGKPWTGTREGLAFAKGEMKAIIRNMNS